MYKKMFSSSSLLLKLSYTKKNKFSTPCHQLITKTHTKFGLLIKYFSIENYDDDDILFIMLLLLSLLLLTGSALW